MGGGGGGGRSVDYRAQTECCTNPVVIGGSGVLVAGNDLRRHPVRSANERVPLANGAVQLSRHAKVHCRGRDIDITAIDGEGEWPYLA